MPLFEAAKHRAKAKETFMEKFDFKKDQKEAEKIESLQEQLLFWKKRLKEFNQYSAGRFMPDFEWEGVKEQYQYEVEYVQELFDSHLKTDPLSNSNIEKSLRAASKIGDLQERLLFLKGKRKDYLQNSANNWVSKTWDAGKTEMMKATLEAAIDEVQELIKYQPKQQAKPAKEIKPIPWQGANAQLVYLFQRLKDEGLLPKYNWNMNDALEKHFLNKKGEPLVNVAQTIYNYENKDSGKPSNPDIVDKIINETKEQKPDKT